LHAYVCGNACVQPVDNMGTVTFTWLFLHRPADCRYAIVSQWDVKAHADKVLVFDLYETQENIKSGRLVTPAPVRVCDSIDAAIMATTLLYEDD
jgi:hypothetical protein